jgi:hypothetical protein
LLAAGTTFATDNNDNKADKDNKIKDAKALVIKGKVIGDNGKPLEEAEIHVKPLNSKAADSVVVTDSRGKFIILGLPYGDYTVTAFDDHGFARSRAIIKTDRKGWANVNFDLRLDQGLGDGANTIHGHLHEMGPTSHMGQFHQ